MKKILIFLLISQCTILFSQKNVKMYHEKNGDVITYYADNQEIYPVSLVFSGEPETDNIKKPELFKTTQVIPAKTERFKVTTFIINDKKKSWAVKKMPGYLIYIGDITLKNYDTMYPYDLPYQKGKSFNIHQGYNGAFSHQNENSLDFTMPEGTEIIASREGLVIESIQHNNQSCPSRDCALFGNFISVLHSDGTIAQYFHLKQNGSKVNVGDNITKGQPIALSGNTGWSNGPHLHFMCFLPSATGEKNRVSIKTLFRTGDGTKTEYLSEKKFYPKNY